MSNDVMIQIQGDISGLQKELNKVKKEITGVKDTTQSAFGGITKTLKGVGGAIATAFAVDKLKDFGIYALQSASDVEEMENKFNVVFKNIGADVDKWAGDFAGAIGRTKTEIKTGVVNLGDLLTGYGMTEKAGADLSKQVITLAYDLASFNNVNDADAIDRMTKGILGEHEGLKVLGISLNEATLQGKMLEMGLTGQFAKLSEVQKAQVRYAVMLDQTKNAQGDAERSAGSYANSLKSLKAKIQDAVETFGSKLLPIATDIVNALIPIAGALTPIAETMGGALASAINTVTGLFGTLVEKVQGLPKFFSDFKLECIAVGLAIGVVAGAIGLYALAQNWMLVTTALGVTALNIWSGVCAIATGITSALSVAVAFLTSPFGLVAIAIVGVIAVGYLLIKNWETVKEACLNIWNGIKEFFGNLWIAIKDTAMSIWNGIKEFFIALWTGISDFFMMIWNGIKMVASVVWGAIKTVITTIMTIIATVIMTIWNSIYAFIKPILDLIKTVITAVWQGIQMVIAVILSVIFGIIKVIWEGIKLYITTVLNIIHTVVSTVWNVIKTVITTILNVIMTIVSTIWSAIKTVISVIMGVIKTVITMHWNVIKTVISTILNIIKTIVSTVWDAIKGTISTILNAIKTVVSTIWNGIKAVISGVVNTIKTVVSTGFNVVKNSVTSIFNGLKGVVMGIWNGIGSGIQGVVNGVIGCINGMVRAMNKINFTVPEWIPLLGGKSFGFSLPEVPTVNWFATGGIFTGPSVIGVGEAGDEAVVPLSNKSKMKPFAQAVANLLPDSRSSNSGPVSAGDVNINIASLIVREEADIQRIAKELKTLQDRENRKRGL